MKRILASIAILLLIGVFARNVMALDQGIYMRDIQLKKVVPTPPKNVNVVEGGFSGDFPKTCEGKIFFNMPCTMPDSGLILIIHLEYLFSEDLWVLVTPSIGENIIDVSVQSNYIIPNKALKKGKYVLRFNLGLAGIVFYGFEITD